MMNRGIGDLKNIYRIRACDIEKCGENWYNVNIYNYVRKPV